MRTKVTIVDYGMGNIRSVRAAMVYLGAIPTVSSNPREIARAETIILPGVGSFPAAMATIASRYLDTAIKDSLGNESTRLLGICLGMQLLGTSSEEGGGALGLGLLDFTVSRFSSDLEANLPIPHIGFNEVNAPQDSILFRDILPGSDFYFVHSYRVDPSFEGLSEAHCTYGQKFVAAIEENQIFGTQFHPEKSQTNGLKLLSNFLEISK